MSFTNLETTFPVTANKQIINKGEEDSPTIIKIRDADPFLEQDCSIVLQAFEVEASEWQQEDYAQAYIYRDVYNTRNFSERSRKQLDYYPGMHQTNNPPKEDPFYTEANKMATNRLNYWNEAMDNPESFENALRNKEKSFEYEKIFGSDATAEERASNSFRLITECIPCFDRILDKMQLLPDGDLLEVHGLNIKIRTDLLDKIRELFRDPGFNIDLCDMLKLLSHQCPQDLLALLALLTQYLAKLNLDIKFNLNFIIQLVGPLLSPFLDALSGWLDKWMDLIITPVICVIDHINETILISQTMKIPFSEVSGKIDGDINVAGPHFNASGSPVSAGVSAASPVADKEPHFASWTKAEGEAFFTPDKERYNPEFPKYPVEETQLAYKEAESGMDNKNGLNGVDPIEREERDKRWKELRDAEHQKRTKVPPPLKPSRGDGTRWSKDDIPDSDKAKGEFEWSSGYYPPEKQTKPVEPVRYIDLNPFVNSMVQFRNILQGAVQYVRDWFIYTTQMLYDLLGTDFGWMNKKIDNTMLKSRIIQLIYMIKAIMEAISKNGLECGKNTNYDPGQYRYITEIELNNNEVNRKYFIDDNGDTHIMVTEDTLPLYSLPTTNSADSSIDSPSKVVIHSSPIANQNLEVPVANKQKFVDSGIIIKDCFKDVTNKDLNKVLNWISDFEKRGVV